MSVGSLYQYFPSKEALVAALVERHIDAMTECLDASIGDLATARVPDAVRHMVALMVAAHAIEPALHKVLVEQIPRIGRLDKVHGVERRFTELTRAYLEAHRDEIRPRDLDLAAFVAVQTVEALTHATVIHHPERFRSDELIEEITTLVVRYLWKGPAPGRSMSGPV